MKTINLKSSLTNGLSLEELIKKCKKHNRQAQEELYRKYSGVLFGICLKYSPSKAEAEDNLHDSFLTIFDKIDQYKFKGSFEGWIKRITVNTVIQKYRKETLLNVLTEPVSDSVELENDYNEISLSKLLEYIQELPNRYRITFCMYVLDEYSHKEISEMLGTSTGTSKSNLARARMILKDRIEKENINIA